MCFNYSLTKQAEYLEKYFNVKFKELDVYKPFYNISGFDTPVLPVICSDDSSHIQFLQWGLIPYWINDEKSANDIKFKTLNARAETLTEKPSFKTSIKNKRCLILADGFFEWHEKDKKKYPFYIKLKNESPFAFAGIWDLWENKSSNTILKTFSLITTNANNLLEKIHNVKKRMPVILKHEDEKKWLDINNKSENILKLLSPYEDEKITAYPVSKFITLKNVKTDSQEAIKPYNYPELEI